MGSDLVTRPNFHVGGVYQSTYGRWRTQEFVRNCIVSCLADTLATIGVINKLNETYLGPAQGQ